jgi:hypothetical protein
MMKIGSAALALFLTTSSATYAQAPVGTQPDRLNAAEFKEFTDRRIEVVKAALQLKPDQEKYWPAVEEAIRARATGRYARLENLLTQREQQQGNGAIEAIAVDPRRWKTVNHWKYRW